MFDEDLDQFFEARDFAVEALVDDAVCMHGIFDNPTSLDLEIVGTSPTFTLPTARLAAALADLGQTRAEGRTLEIGGTLYKVVPPVSPDGTGVTVLTLERQPTTP